jgi:hypothetical protein
VFAGGPLRPPGSAISPGCPERVDPRRTILGAEQRRWLLRGLDRSRARWNVLAQQVVMAELDIRPGPGRSWWSEAWDGYAADRDRLLRFLWERQPANPVVLTGDIHAYMVNDLKVDNRRPDAPVVATELVGTSISSSAGKFESFVKYLRDNPPHPVLRQPPPRLHPLHGHPPALVRRPAGGRHRGAAGRRRAHPGLVRGRGRPPGRRAGLSPRNTARMGGVDNHIWGCLGSTVTDRSRGSEPEFAGLRTKPRKP